MRTGARWLIDKSAYARLGTCSRASEWAARIEQGLVHVATPTVLEVGYSARSGGDWAASVNAPPLALMPVENATPTIEARAVEVQGVLARQGHHRAPSVPDLLIAATAELAGLIVLHYDKDFRLISQVTGQLLEELELAD
ncbi:MAG: PIN domain nuclease [Nocardioidaceae bacterium]